MRRSDALDPADVHTVAFSKPPLGKISGTRLSSSISSCAPHRRTPGLPFVRWRRLGR
ncbi:MAG: hypothetical protein ACRDQU_03110 [Pseudonocardiaceae bacterium]